MPGCVLRYCKNSSRNLKNSEEISFHRFPGPGHEKREQWIKFVQNDRSEDTWLPTKHTRVCSEHFRKQDYCTTKKGRRFLKKSAVPLDNPLDSENHRNQSPNTLLNVHAFDLESILDSAIKIKLKEDIRKMTVAKRILVVKNKKLVRQCRYLRSRNQKLTDIIEVLKSKLPVESLIDNENKLQEVAVVETDVEDLKKHNLINMNENKSFNTTVNIDPVQTLLDVKIKTEPIWEEEGQIEFVNIKKERDNEYGEKSCIIEIKIEEDVKKEPEDRQSGNESEEDSGRTSLQDDSVQTELKNEVKEEEIEVEVKINSISKEDKKKYNSKENKDKPFKCKKCKHSFCQRSSLNRHSKIHLGDRVFECPTCFRCFDRNTRLKDHIRIHTGEKPFECFICQMRFGDKGNLGKHLTVHVDERPFRCRICMLRYKRKDDLKTHMRIHVGEKLFACTMCEKKFCKRGNLEMHVRTHTGEKPFQCDVCDVTFNRKDILVKHLRTHTGEKPFVCPICQRRFTCNRLKSHLRIHSGERPFQCAHCSKLFRKKTQLIVHLKIHEEKKPYHCKLCNEIFNKKNDYYVHIKIHKGGVPYECQVCNRKFSQKGHFTEHIKTHSEKKKCFVCTECPKKYCDKSSLTRHMRERHKVYEVPIIPS